MSSAQITITPDQYAVAHHRKKMMELYGTIAAGVVVLTVIVIFISVKYRAAARFVGTWTPTKPSVQANPDATPGTISYTLAAGSSKYELVDATSASSTTAKCTLNGPYTYKFGKLMKKVKQYDDSAVLMSEGTYDVSDDVVTITWSAPSTAYSGTGAPAIGAWSFTLPKKSA